jgi:hypothetical protein
MQVMDFQPGEYLNVKVVMADYSDPAQQIPYEQY